MESKRWKLKAAAGFISMAASVMVSAVPLQVGEEIREAEVRMDEDERSSDPVELSELTVRIVNVDFEAANSENRVSYQNREVAAVADATDDTDATDSIWEEQLSDYFGYIPTDEDMDLFYRTVQAECGYQEPDDGVGAVADVIANRCRSGLFPDTITGVVKQKNQFSTWPNGMIAAAVPSEQVMDVCRSRIEGGVVYSDILFFTAGYYNPYCEPAFVIGHVYFGTEKKW